jgi:hypothetical protein
VNIQSGTQYGNFTVNSNPLQFQNVTFESPSQFFNDGVIQFKDDVTINYDIRAAFSATYAEIYLNTPYHSFGPITLYGSTLNLIKSEDSSNNADIQSLVMQVKLFFLTFFL